VKQFAMKSAAFLFFFVLLLSSTGFSAPLSMLSEQDKQTILQQSAVQPPENAKVTDIWLEPSDMALETKTVQAFVGEYLRIVLVCQPNKNREWQYVDDKPRFLEKLHSQQITIPSNMPALERQTANLYLFKVLNTAAGDDRLTFVQYKISEGEKAAVSMLDLGVRYYNPELQKKL